jgi:hypothetical protein
MVTTCHLDLATLSRFNISDLHTWMDLPLVVWCWKPYLVSRRIAGFDIFCAEYIDNIRQVPPQPNTSNEWPVYRYLSTAVGIENNEKLKSGVNVRCVWGCSESIIRDVIAVNYRLQPLSTVWYPQLCEVTTNVLNPPSQHPLKSLWDLLRRAIGCLESSKLYGNGF